MNGSTLTALCVWLAAAGAAPRTEDWAQFRGPTGQGHASATGLPVTWTTTENVDWRRTVPGKGWSSPIVWGSQVFVTSAIPLGDSDLPEQSLRALCLDAGSGETLWDVEVFRQPPGAGIHGKNSHASATPITDGERLYVHFGTYGTAALDLKGKVLWTTKLDYNPVHGNGGSPVLVDDLLVVSCDGGDVQFVAALDRRDGGLRWKKDRSTTPDKGFSFSTPLVIEVDGRTQLVSAGADAVFAYEPASGKELWRVNYTGGFSVVPRPVFGQGLLFVCTGYNIPSLLAIRPAGARGDATATHIAWTLKKAVPNNPSPLIVGDALYLVSDNGVVTCLNATAGTERWQQRVGGNFSASPLFADGRIYLQNEAGEGITLRADDGEYVELGRSNVGEKTLASYAVSGGALFIRSENHLLRVQAK